MNTRILIVALLAWAPAAVAQRGGTGETALEEAPSRLSSRAMQKFDAIKLILDKKKDLKIEDAQRGGLTELEDQVQWNIKRLSGRVDSVQKASAGRNSPASDDGAYTGGGVSSGRGRGGGRRSDGDVPDEPPEVRRQRILEGRRIVNESVQELQREFDSSSARALRLLSDAQRPAAADLLTRRATELQKMLKDAGFVLPKPKSP